MAPVLRGATRVATKGGKKDAQGNTHRRYVVAQKQGVVLEARGEVVLRTHGNWLRCPIKFFGAPFASQTSTWCGSRYESRQLQASRAR